MQASATSDAPGPAPQRSTGVAGDTGPRTRADWVDCRLRDAILRGELVPGQKLVAAALAEQLGVSPTPLREAFQRLSGHGLVEIEPQRGARVAPVSLADAEELYELRLLLEPMAVRRSVAAADGAFRRRLEAAHAALTADWIDLVTAVERHRRFHLALVAACPSRRLRHEVEELSGHAQRYQLLGSRRDEGHATAADEHAELLAVALAGDARAAERLTARHLRATLEQLRRLAAHRHPGAPPDRRAAG